MTYIADEYAAVLFQLNISSEDCEDFKTKLDGCPELYVALDNPTVTAAEKHRVIDKVFNRDIASFVRLLCDNGRISLYREIYASYKSLVNAQNGVLEADFICTSVPERAQLDRVSAMLAKKYNKKSVALDVKTDESLIGGFMLKVGDTEYDKSVRGALNDIKRKIDLNGGGQSEHY